MATLKLAAAVLLCSTGAMAESIQRLVDQGTAVEFRSDGLLQAGELIGFQFDLHDTAGASALTGLRPAAWLARRERGAPAKDCTRQVATFVGGDLFNRAEVNLNNYFVLTLNQSASISVVDPLFGFGGSKLLAILPLHSPGADWALAGQQDRLFVSMPGADQVAVADTRRWRIEANLATGPNPRRLRIQTGRAWVADDRGLTAIDLDSLTTQSLSLGAVRELATSDDGQWLFAATATGLTIVDAHSARVLTELELDGQAQVLAWSSAAKSVYAMDPVLGRVFVIDPRAQVLTATIELDPGASQIGFAPGGRFALIANPTRDRIQVLDAASGTIVQNAAISHGPDRIYFSELLAYVHRRNSEIVLMIPLAQLGAGIGQAGGAQLGVADFPGGQNPLGKAGLADRIVSAPEGLSVLVTNPVDRMIYLYKEGMAAPAGGFSTYGQIPTAALVVDYGLREQERGSYATRVPVAAAGSYDVVLFVDSPRVVACFALEVAEDPAQATAISTRITAIDPPSSLQAGAPVRLRFALFAQPRGSTANGPPSEALAQRAGRAEADDVRALVMQAPGVWQRRSALRPTSDASYELEFVPPQPGTYYVWIESESLGLARNNSQFQIFQVD